MKTRCDWCAKDPLYVSYHDNEWGVPVFDDQKLFEFLLLETFQAGLSWITILRKRENFRMAFEDFDLKKIASYDEEKFGSLLNDPGIIRHRLKIRAASANARAFIKLQKEYGTFSKYLWQYTDGGPIHNLWETSEDVPSSTPLSQSISKDLKKKGFKFVGPTVVYAFMQAVGMVNDHLTSCYRHNEVSP